MLCGEQTAGAEAGQKQKKGSLNRPRCVVRVGRVSSIDMKVVRTDLFLDLF